MKTNAAQTLQVIKNNNTNDNTIKQAITFMCQTREKVTYHALFSSSGKYLEVKGLLQHEYDEFSQINRLLQNKITHIVGAIQLGALKVRDLHQESQIKQIKQNIEKKKNKQIVEEVRKVVNSMDLPISLFEREDKYWSADNPKTLQAKQYVHTHNVQERNRKRNQRMRQQKIRQQASKKKQQEISKLKREQQEKRRLKREYLQSKILELKKNSEYRKRIIEESEKMTSQLQPLYRRIEKENQKNHLQALKNYQSRLSEIKQRHGSVDMKQIQRHCSKLQEIQRSRIKKQIINSPMSVSFKSKYHQTLDNHSQQSQDKIIKSLYEKKMEYCKVVKNVHKPKLNTSLVKQMKERLKVLKRKRVRKNPKKKPEEQEHDSQEFEQLSQSNSENDEKQYSQEDEESVQIVRGEDQDPDRRQRYQMGCQYLEYMKKMKKKKQKPTPIQEDELVQKSQTTSRNRYKDYLREFVTTNKTTIDQIDTSKLTNTGYLISMNGKDFGKLTKYENEIRQIEQRSRNQQQLLKVRKLKSLDARLKKNEIDNAMVQTIKARLALMG